MACGTQWLLLDRKTLVSCEYKCFILAAKEVRCNLVQLKPCFWERRKEWLRGTQSPAGCYWGLLLSSWDQIPDKQQLKEGVYRQLTVLRYSPVMAIISLYLE